MTKPDDDMIRIAELLAAAKSICTCRQWNVFGYFLDEAEAVLLGIEPGNGEKGTVEFRPASRYKPDAGEW